MGALARHRHREQGTGHNRNLPVLLTMDSIHNRVCVMQAMIAVLLATLHSGVFSCFDLLSLNYLESFQFVFSQDRREYRLSH